MFMFLQFKTSKPMVVTVGRPGIPSRSVLWEIWHALPPPIPSSSPCSYDWWRVAPPLSTEPRPPFSEAIPPPGVVPDLEGSWIRVPGPLVLPKCQSHALKHCLIIVSLVRSTAQQKLRLHFLLQTETRSLLWASVIEPGNPQHLKW